MPLFHPNLMGPATEILQAQQPPPAPVADAPPEEPREDDTSPKAIVLPSPLVGAFSTPVEDAAITPPEAEKLEILPDAEIDSLCIRILPRVDGRWSRETKIAKLLAAGVTDISQAPPPAPEPEELESTEDSTEG